MPKIYCCLLGGETAQQRFECSLNSTFVAEANGRFGSLVLSYWVQWSALATSLLSPLASAS